MGKSHTVKQGENLNSIAKQNGLSSAMYIWYHSSNDSLREKRVSADLLMPGDLVNIPEPTEIGSMQLATNKRHKIVIYKSKADFISLQLVNGAGEPFKLAQIELTIGSEVFEHRTDENGVFKIVLGEINTESGHLKVLSNNRLKIPQCNYQLKFSHLDPIQETSGVQARLNNLNHPCGEVDGVLGDQTKSAIVSFQREQQLKEDGNPGPETQKKLVEVYGC